MEEKEYLPRREHEEFARRMESENSRRDDENRRQNKRLDALEDGQKEIHAISLSVERLAVNMESMLKEQSRQGKKIDEQAEKIDAIEKQPADKWNKAVWIVVSVVITALVTFALTRLGM